MKKILLLLFLWLMVVSGHAQSRTEYEYLPFRTTSLYLSSHYGTEQTQRLPARSMAVTAAANSSGATASGGAAASPIRRAYGNNNDDGFFDDDEGFATDPEDDNFYDPYTKEPGELPIGDIPVLWLLLLAGLHAVDELRHNNKGAYKRG